MIDDNKHQKTITVRLTDREYIDVCQEAERMDKKASEVLRFFARERMYGTVRRPGPDGNETNSSE